MFLMFHVGIDLEMSVLSVFGACPVTRLALHSPSQAVQPRFLDLSPLLHFSLSQQMIHIGLNLVKKQIRRK